MPKNNGLTKAKSAKKDEFYTSYDDIQSEINNFEDGFAGKTVLCNCDDPFESNFSKFFLRNFNYLKLKRLICTSYAGSPVAGTQMSLFDNYNEPVESNRGYVLDISSVPMANGRGVSDDDINTLLHKRGIVKRLKGNGDYRSDECLNYLKQADMVVTNPPFSKFREFVKTLFEYNKQFLIIGNQNAITYKEIFPLIKDNKMWLGKPFKGNVGFFKSLYEDVATASQHKEGLIRVSGVMWYTNLDYSQRHEDLILYKHYLADEYPKYDNYDAIEVSKVLQIPLDYDGAMGVPITFLDKFNPDQFEILGMSGYRGKYGADWLGIKPIGQQWLDSYRAYGGKGHYSANMIVPVYSDGNGVPKSIYARILIKNKKVQK